MTTYFFFNIEIMTDWINRDPLLTQVMDSIGFNNFFYKLFYLII